MKLEVTRFMKRYLNKALLFKEFKNAKWFIMVFTISMFIEKIMCFLNISRSIDELSRNKVSNMESFKIMYRSQVLFSGYKILFSIFFVAAGALLIFGLDNKNYRKLLTMPFKKKDIAINKCFVALISVLIPFTFIYFMMLIIRATNYANATTYLSYADITVWYLFQALTAAFNILFIGMILTLCGNNIFALLVSGIFIMYPTFFFDTLESLYRLIYKISLAAQGFGNNALNDVYSNNEFLKYNIFYNLGNLLSPTLYEQYLGQWKSLNINYLIGLCILCIVLIGIIILSYEKISYEERTKLIPFKGLQGFFSFGVSLSFGLLAVPMFVNPGTSTINAYNYGYYIIKLLIIFFGVIICGYLINSKILNKFCR